MKNFLCYITFLHLLSHFPHFIRCHLSSLTFLCRKIFHTLWQIVSKDLSAISISCWVKEKIREFYDFLRIKFRNDENETTFIAQYSQSFWSRFFGSFQKRKGFSTTRQTETEQDLLGKIRWERGNKFSWIYGFSFSPFVFVFCCSNRIQRKSKHFSRFISTTVAIATDDFSLGFILYHGFIATRLWFIL